jgi:hypothetical protein
MIAAWFAISPWWDVALLAAIGIAFWANLADAG